MTDPFWKYARLAGVVVALLVLGFSHYTAYKQGKLGATAEWTIKLETLKANVAKVALTEQTRQQSIVDDAEVKLGEALNRIAAQRTQLEDLQYDLAEQAAHDEFAGRICLSPDSLRRLERTAPLAGPSDPAGEAAPR